MKVLVVYDSVFGNTEKIALALAAALETQAVPVGQLDSDRLRGLDLLVVGSPTRRFRSTEGISSLLNGLAQNHLADVIVAAFDTRMDLEVIKAKIFRFIVDKGGYAADAIARMLKKKGGILRAPGEGFLVIDEKGPLKEGELERAQSWARGLRAEASISTR